MTVLFKIYIIFLLLLGFSGYKSYVRARRTTSLRKATAGMAFVIYCAAYLFIRGIDSHIMVWISIYVLLFGFLFFYFGEIITIREELILYTLACCFLATLTSKLLVLFSLLEILGVLSIYFYFADLRLQPRKWRMRKAQAALVILTFYNAICTAFFMLGVTMLYKVYGNAVFDIFNLLQMIRYDNEYNLALHDSTILGFVFIGIYFLFKLGVAPFHGWIVGLYRKLTLYGILYLAVISKFFLVLGFVKYFFIFFFIVKPVGYGLCLVGLLSYFYSSFIAYKTRDSIAAIIAYSGIAQASLLFTSLAGTYLLLLDAIYFYMLYMFSCMLVFLTIAILYVEGFEKLKRRTVLMCVSMDELFTENILFNTKYNHVKIFALLVFVLLSGLPPMFVSIVKLILFSDILLMGNLGIIISLFLLVVSTITLNIYLRFLLSLLVSHRRELRRFYFKFCLGYEEIYGRQFVYSIFILYIFALFVLCPSTYYVYIVQFLIL